MIKSDFVLNKQNIVFPHMYKLGFTCIMEGKSKPPTWITAYKGRFLQINNHTIVYIGMDVYKLRLDSEELYNSIMVITCYCKHKYDFNMIKLDFFVADY